MHSFASTASVPAERSHLRRIARRLSDPDLSPGALAALRRGGPDTVLHEPAFHRVVRDVDDAALGPDGATRWATAVRLLALVTRPGISEQPHDIGRALAAAGFPESRLARLLASRGESFRDQATLAVRFLRGRDVTCTPLDLAELALVEERAEGRAERLRFRIARGYFRVMDADTRAK